MTLRSHIQEAIQSTFSGELADICDPPIWAVQRAEYPGFRMLGKTVPTHLTPGEILDALGLGAPEQWSVLTIAFPRNKEIVAEIAASSDFPPKSWFASKIVKMRALPAFGLSLVEHLAAMGVDAFVAPGEGLQKTAQNQEGTRFDNTWSEKHVGYVCGLGTFGLHGALITDVGCTHRLLSLMVNVRFSEYDRMDENPFGNCLYHTKGLCGTCIERCPAGAVQVDGYDPMKCREQSYVTNRTRVREDYGLEMAGCALCMTGVPCSRRDPMKRGENEE